MVKVRQKASHYILLTAKLYPFHSLWELTVTSMAINMCFVSFCIKNFNNFPTAFRAKILFFIVMSKGPSTLDILRNRSSYTYIFLSLRFYLFIHLDKLVNHVNLSCRFYSENIDLGIHVHYVQNKLDLNIQSYCTG